MRHEITKQEKIEILKAAIKEIKNNYERCLCFAIGTWYDLQYDFPEVYKYKPYYAKAYWWPRNSIFAELRIRILEQAIKEIEGRTDEKEVRRLKRAISFWVFSYLLNFD